MFRHVLPGNNNACLICHEIMKRDPAGYLTGCRLMVYYMGVKQGRGTQNWPGTDSVGWILPFNCRFYSFPHSQPFMLHQINHQMTKVTDFS